MKIKLIISALFVLNTCIVFGQDTIQTQIQNLQDEIKSLKSMEKTNFMIRGFAQFGFEASKENSNFSMTSFNPVLLWRQGDRFLFESELEMAYANNELDIHLGYANASYIVSRGLIVRAGKFLIPFGTFGEKFHPAWINKLSTMPLGIGHGGIVPMSDFGVEVRGGLQLGSAKMNYSLYVVNGPGIKDGKEEPKEAGMLSFENATDNNKNKAIGTRIGILPLSNSSLEIGFSGYYSMPGAMHSPFEDDSLNEDLNYKNMSAMLSAVDLSYVKSISQIKGMIDIKGQYNISNISGATYFNPEDTSRYTFPNRSVAYYIQMAYRPTMLDNNILKNVELVGRYSVHNTPMGSLWNSNQSQIAVGLNYWLTWRTVLKASYQATTIKKDGADGDPHGGSPHGGATGNMFFVNLAVGF